MFQVPDWGRRAIRLSLSLLFFTSLSVTMWLLPKEYRAEYADEFVQSCNWAGATCAVVAASPLLGKVVQLSYERTLGTITGGLLGYLVYDYGILYLPPLWDNILLCCAAAAVGVLSCFLSDRLKLDASMRLFVITFLLVTFGAHPADGAAAVALLRTGGIVLGVLVFMALSVLVLPKSASMESLRELRKGLKLLVELNDMVWATPAHDCKGSDASNSCQDQGPLSRKASHAALCPLHHHHQPGANSSQPLNGGGSSSSMTGPARGEASVVDLVEAGLGPNTPYGTKAAGCPVCAAHETKCEKVLTDVYQSTFKVKDHVGLAANEAYVWHFWGHYFFLPVMFKRVPLVKWCWRGLLGLLGRDEEARWAAIQSDTDEVATCVRRMARLLWMLHLDYTESFAEGIVAQLRAAYPPHLTRASLAEALGRALKELLQDFPDHTHIVIDPFQEFNRLVDEMLDISNAQRRSLLQRLAAPPKPFRPKRTFYRTQSAIGPPDVFVTLRPPAGPADAESPAFSSPDIGTQTATSTPFAAGDASLQQPLLSPLADSNAAAGGSMIERPRNLLSAVSIRDSRLASGRAPLTAFHAAILMQQQAAARAANGQARPGATPPAQQQKGFTVPTTEHGNAASSTAAMPEGGAEKRPGGTSPSGGSPQPSLLSQALRVSDSGGGPTPASTTAAAAAAVAAPAAAAGVAASAPAGWAGCNILWPSPGAADGSHQGSPGPWAAGDEEQPQQQQLLFPATEQGVAAEVRWYSFQFLVDEIAEELEELYLAASTLLHRLPYHAQATAAAPAAAAVAAAGSFP